MAETEAVPNLCKAPEKYDEYNFSLADTYKQMAQDELREDDSIRESSLQQFRDWIAKHPLIKKCRTGELKINTFWTLPSF